MAKKQKTGKETQPVKCSQCEIEFPDTVLSEKHRNKAFVWKGKVMCEDCLFKMGISAQDAQTYAAFVESQPPQRPPDY